MSNGFIKILKEKFSYSDNTKTGELKSSLPSGLSYIVTSICAAAVFISHYIYCKDFCVKSLSDLGAHLTFASEYDLTSGEGFLYSWARVPHLGWHMLVRFFAALHMPIEEAASLVYSLLAVFAFIASTYLVYRMIRHYLLRNELLISSLCAGISCFVGPLAMPWFTPLGIYHGQYSPNPFHNPTHMAVKGFGILLIMLGVDIFRKVKCEKLIFFKSDKNLYLKFGILLFVSSIFKPTFMYMLLPAGFVFMITELCIVLKTKSYPLKNIFSSLIKLIISVIPSIALMIIENIVISKYGDPTAITVFSFSKPFEVWHLYTLSVPNSILLAMLFPIVICIMNPGYFLKSTEGRLSVISYFVGIFEFSFLKDAGYQMISANFAWCMMSGMVVLYIFTIAKLAIETLREGRNTGHMISICTCWFILLLHGFSGISFMLERPM